MEAYTDETMRYYVLHFKPSWRELLTIIERIVKVHDYKFSILNEAGDPYFRVNGYDDMSNITGAYALGCEPGNGEETYAELCQNKRLWKEFEENYCFPEEIDEDDDTVLQSMFFDSQYLDECLAWTAMLPNKVEVKSLDDFDKIMGQLEVYQLEKSL